MHDDDASASAVAELLDQLTRQLRTGQVPNLTQELARFPQYQSEIQELWEAVLVAEGAAKWDSQHGHALDPLPPGSGPKLLDATITPPGLHLVATLSGNDLANHGVVGLGGSTLGPLAAQHSHFGDYEIVGELGRGGMGVVYLAWQQSLGREVALKTILKGNSAGDVDRARFQREATAAARLEHPNIVPVYEVGEFEGHPYLCMKRISGSTLSAKLAAGPIPPRAAAQLLLPICKAIHYAHERGVLHRDLKPSNILIDDDGTPYVTDFGLAKQTTNDPTLTKSGAALGTPSFMAPEQAAGNRGTISPASDVYSLGAILYQMLTGRPPFQAASAMDTLLLVLEQDPIPPRTLNPRADRDLELIALRCLQKPPDLRYASCLALANDLEAYLSGETVSARSGGITQVVSRWFRETHHAPVLENWGLLWMWHSLASFILCVLTNGLQLSGVTSPWPYLGLWTFGFWAWAIIFFTLRRRGGPVTFVERQITHTWAAGLAGSGLLFVIEVLLGLQALTLSPVLALIAGMVFLVKAGMLTGHFYVQAVAFFATGVIMAWWPSTDLPQIQIGLYGLVLAGAYFVPGLKYYRQQQENARASSRE